MDEFIDIKVVSGIFSWSLWQLKDIKVNQTESEDTEIEKSEEFKNTPFEQLEESTEETLPCEDLDLEGPTQEMIDLEDQKENPKQEQNGKQKKISIFLCFGKWLKLC